MTCSALWDEAGLPAYGTAPQARFWVAVEQNGPWGRDALVESHLDPLVGAGLRDACLAAGGRALLVRNPVAHADSSNGTRTVFVSGGTDRPWLLSGQVDDPALLLALDFAALSSLEPDEAAAATGWLRPAESVLFVCTNGKRDHCCAVRGRRLAVELASRHPQAVWECSHTGGHRLAPTGIVLPTGQALARLEAGVAEAALVAARHGELAPEALGPRHDRGLCRLAVERAVAESLVRARTGRTEVPLAPHVAVGHVARTPGPILPESCGGEPVASWLWMETSG